ncbi:hypothetical protein [cyanobacterium endosymbiont of Epithemia turgida]|uniref:hypothetical protein n=1 Tax=cyanobacterium endosymbiont of Epithemia turgida TaxID=718217 RepID=UPI0004D1CCC8|nr:hypothetical protein [cyanobacterium endosymbiont of Epithemia turgida]BAP17992.1 hypothetical protein ETSB_1233 [cyanobacterium endosymbiont of Epithemia turgida isolate EtSB Lake Yunoko]
MTNKPNVSRENAIEQVDVEIIKTDQTTSNNPPVRPIQDETKALIKAIKTKAFSEVQKVGEFALDNYLEAVRKARQDIERRQLFEPEQIEDAIKQIQKEIEKDWDSIVSEITSFSDRLNEAAKAAWDILTASKAQADEDKKK